MILTKQMNDKALLKLDLKLITARNYFVVIHFG